MLVHTISKRNWRYLQHITSLLFPLVLTKQASHQVQIDRTQASCPSVLGKIVRRSPTANPEASVCFVVSKLQHKLSTNTGVEN
jgi:hypothetical protein